MGKWLGAVLILCSSTGLGFKTASDRRQALRLLETLRQMILFLKGEITYRRCGLEEALEQVGKREKGELSRLFLDTADAIRGQGGESFCQIWRKNLENFFRSGQGRLLSKEDRERLEELGEHLGYLDVEMQEKTLLLYLERLESRIRVFRGSIRESCRLCTGLGVMGGLFLVILMF